MEMSEIPEELYESYPAMSAKYHADMIEEYVQKRLKSSQARLSEAVKVLEPFGKLEVWSDGADDADIVIMTVGTIRKVRQFLATLGEET